MRESELNLTIEELETLCNLYMECKLTPLEEVELEFVLQNTNLQSPLITDVKKIMGLEEFKFIKSISQTRRNFRKNKWIKLIPGIAASILIMALVSSYIISSYQISSSPETIYCRVYSNGHQIDYDEALEIANKNLEKMVAFEEKIKMIQIREKEKIEEFNNKNIMP